MIPAKRIDKEPAHNFAVISLRQGNETAELESSFALQATAELMFARQYSKWGLQDTSFWLVDWQKQIILREHKPQAA